MAREPPQSRRHKPLIRLVRGLPPLERPLLLVRDGFPGEQQEEEHCQRRVDGAERRLVLPRGESAQGDEHEERVLVEHDEEEVEERELPGLHPCPQDRPAVVLGAGVAAFAREVEGESGAPEGDQHCQDVQSDVAEASEPGKHPHVYDRDNRPESINPGVLVGDERGDPREQTHARSDEGDDRQRGHNPTLWLVRAY